MIAEFERRITTLQVACLSKSDELPRLIGFQPYPIFSKLQTAESPEAVASTLRRGQIILAFNA
jgi:hypothetical protein